jgi:hypothetical protein
MTPDEAIRTQLEKLLSTAQSAGLADSPAAALKLS